MSSSQTEMANSPSSAKFPLAHCNGCPLYEYKCVGGRGLVLSGLDGTGKRTVIAPPPDTTEVVFVGEAPGWEEERVGFPFIGVSGKLLEMMVRELGIDKFNPYFDNAISCSQYKRLLEPLDKKEEDVISKDIIERCRSRILKVVLEKKPRLVVLLGGVALKSVLPKARKGIWKLAGSILPGSSYDDSYVPPELREQFNRTTFIPVLHPAYILRSTDEFKFFEEQMEVVKNFLYGFKDPGKVSYIVVDGPISTSKRAQLLEQCSNALDIALDTETTGFYPYRWNKLLSVQISFNYKFGEKGLAWIFEREGIKANIVLLKEVLESRPLICHNGQFDGAFLNFLGIYPSLGFDTLLASYALDERPSHRLKHLCKRFFGVDEWDTKLMEFVGDYDDTGDTSYEKVPPSILRPYSAMDTVYTGRLKDYLTSGMDDSTKRLCDKVLFPGTNMLLAAKNRGVLVDIEYTRGLIKTLKSQMVEADKNLERLTKDRMFNPNSGKKVISALQGFGVLEKHEINVTTEKEELLALKGYNEEADKLIDNIVVWREANKLLYTYLKVVAEAIGSDLCIHPDGKLFGTVTGRLSYSKPFNAQNQPKLRRYKKILRARPGYIWVHVDQSQCEFRVYAHITNDPNLLAIYKEKRDIHTEAGYIMFEGKENYEREKAKRENRFGYARALRDDVKTVTFGLLYNRGAPAIAEAWGEPIEVAQEWVRRIKAYWKGSADYEKRVKEEIRRQHYIENSFGRRRRFPLITDDNWHKCVNEGINFPIQSTASDLNLLSMIRCWELGSKRGLIYPLWPVHDAIEFEVQEDKFDEGMSLIKESCEPYLHEVLGGSKVDFKIEVRHGEAWDCGETRD